MKNRNFIWLTIIAIATLAACRHETVNRTLSVQTPQTRNAQAGMTSIPFSLKATYVASSKTSEETVDFAVKGDKWLIQLPSWKARPFILGTDKVYVIDHEKQTFYEPDNNELELLGVKDIEKGKELSTGIFAWATFGFFGKRPGASLMLSAVSTIWLLTARETRPLSN